MNQPKSRVGQKDRIQTPKRDWYSFAHLMHPVGPSATQAEQD